MFGLMSGGVSYLGSSWRGLTEVLDPAEVALDGDFPFEELPHGEVEYLYERGSWYRGSGAGLDRLRGLITNGKVACVVVWSAKWEMYWGDVGDGSAWVGRNVIEQWVFARMARPGERRWSPELVDAVCLWARGMLGRELMGTAVVSPEDDDEGVVPRDGLTSYKFFDEEAWVVCDHPCCSFERLAGFFPGIELRSRHEDGLLDVLSRASGSLPVFRGVSGMVPPVVLLAPSGDGFVPVDDGDASGCLLGGGAVVVFTGASHEVRGMYDRISGVPR